MLSENCGCEVSLDLHVTKKRAELTRAHRERNRAANRSADNQGSAPRAVHDQHGLDRRTEFRVMRRSIDVVDLVAADDLSMGKSLRAWASINRGRKVGTTASLPWIPRIVQL